jgi:molybdate transport system regulatory protein
VKRAPLSLIIRIDFGVDARLGPGKVRLLEQIAKTGSISAGGRALDMSYKRAWELVDEMKVIFGAPVVESKAGGSKGGGATLTDLGQSVVTCYRKLESKAAAATKDELRELQKAKRRR